MPTDAPKQCPVWLNQAEHDKLQDLVAITKREMNRQVGLLVEAALAVETRKQKRQAPPRAD